MVFVKQEPDITYGVLNRSCEEIRRCQRQQLVASPSEMVVVQLGPSIIAQGAVNSACERSR
eukprot:3370445-Pyramimonas_sp.AAC.1